MKGKFDLARRHHREALALCREMGEHRLMVMSLVNLGEPPCQAGDVAEAEELCHEALRLSVARTALPWIAQALLGIGAALARADREDEAAGLLGVVVHHGASPHWYRERAEALFPEVAAKLPPQTVAVAEARGAAGDLLGVVEEVPAWGRRLRPVASR